MPDRPGGGPGPIGAVRLAVFGFTVLVLLLALLPLQLLWLAFRPRVPSPVTPLFHRPVTAAAGIRVSIEGAPIDHTALIVANHVSWTDILAIGAAMPITFVAKSEVRGWPLLGPLAALNPTLFVHRTERGGARSQIDAIAAALDRGAVAIFPEGTTGNGTTLLPFRSTLFEAARGRRVQPLSIGYRPFMPLADFAWDGDKPFLPHLAAVIAAGGADCTLHFHPAFDAGSIDRKALAQRCRDQIAAGLAR